MRWIRLITLSFAALLIVVAGSGYWLWWQLDLAAEPLADPNADVSAVGFANPVPPPSRGRILAVVSSTARKPDGKRAGYELTELSRAWWVFVHNGYRVDIASPAGGEAPMLLDDIIDADYAFLNDPDARAKLAQTLQLAQVNPQHYAAVYFVGGKGTMFDFPGNADIQRIVRDIAPRGVIGAVCHGPAALLNLRLDSGVNLLKQRAVTGFTNAEELFLIADARTRHGFLLEDALKAEAEFREGPMYLDHTVVDGNLITGQNPWSTWSTAEQMIRALGHEPVARAISNEELSVNLLGTYRRDGIDAAIAHKATLERSDKRLIAMHALIAAMQWQLLDSHRLLRLARAPHR